MNEGIKGKLNLGIYVYMVNKWDKRLVVYIHKWQFIVRGVVVELLIMAVSLCIYIYLEGQYVESDVH